MTLFQLGLGSLVELDNSAKKNSDLLGYFSFSSLIVFARFAQSPKTKTVWPECNWSSRSQVNKLQMALKISKYDSCLNYCFIFFCAAKAEKPKKEKSPAKAKGGKVASEYMFLLCFENHQFKYD